MSSILSKLREWVMGSETNEALATRLAGESREAALAQRWTDAIELAEKAIAADPRYPDGYRMLGFAHLHAGSPERGRDAYERGLRVAPENSWLHWSVGELELELGNYAAAEQAYRRALQFRRNGVEAQYDAEFLFKLGLVLGPQERLGDAVRYLEQALRLAADDFRVYAALGEYRYRLGQNDEAMRMLKEAIARKPDLGLAHHYLGLALIQDGEWEEGLHELRRAVELDPNDESYRGLLAELTARFERGDVTLDEA